MQHLQNVPPKVNQQIRSHQRRSFRRLRQAFPMVLGI